MIHCFFWSFGWLCCMTFACLPLLYPTTSRTRQKWTFYVIYPAYWNFLSLQIHRVSMRITIILVFIYPYFIYSSIICWLCSLILAMRQFPFHFGTVIWPLLDEVERIAEAAFKFNSSPIVPDLSAFIVQQTYLLLKTFRRDTTNTHLNFN